jgi:hypothetical protein
METEMSNFWLGTVQCMSPTSLKKGCNISVLDVIIMMRIGIRIRLFELMPNGSDLDPNLDPIMQLSQVNNE